MAHLDDTDHAMATLETEAAPEPSLEQRILKLEAQVGITLLRTIELEKVISQQNEQLIKMAEAVRAMATLMKGRPDG